MTTDTRTSEQIVQDRLTMMPENERAYVAAKAVEVLRAAGRLVGGPTEALALVEEVIAIYADRIGTHYEDCYKYHVACLAVAVKHRIESEGDVSRITGRRECQTGGAR